RPGRVYATGLASRTSVLPPPTAFAPDPDFPAAPPAADEAAALGPEAAAAGVEPSPPASDATPARGSVGLEAPAPSEPENRGLAQLPALRASGAVPCRRAIELAISCDKFGGKGE